MSFLQQFWENVLNSGIWEFLAVITGIASVWYARKESILVYPIGIISVVIYIFICYNAQLFGDAGINFFYFVVSIYGWYKWTHKHGKPEIREISINTTKEQIIGILLSIASFIGVLYLVRYFNGSNQQYLDSYIPYVDSFTTAIFLIGMWQMALKRLENWIYWIVGDVVSIPLYYSKGLVFSSFQYLVFLIIAIMGYIEWRKRWLERTHSVSQ